MELVSRSYTLDHWNSDYLVKKNHMGHISFILCWSVQLGISCPTFPWHVSTNFLIIYLNNWQQIIYQYRISHWSFLIWRRMNSYVHLSNFCPLDESIKPSRTCQKQFLIMKPVWGVLSGIQALIFFSILIEP